MSPYIIIYMKPDIRENLNSVKINSMSDALIKAYLPNVRIVTSNELNSYTNIEDLLPHNNTFFILLYERTPNNGHWTCVTRNNNEISYFDSYGKEPDYAIEHWFKNNKQQQIKYLSHLLDKTKMNVYYNDFDYQAQDGEISTCGRHVILFIIANTKKKMDLEQYCSFMKKMKNETGFSFDKLVSFFINNTSTNTAGTIRPRLNKI